MPKTSPCRHERQTAFRPSQSGNANAPPNQIACIVEKLPFRQQHAIQRPKIEMLITMKAANWRIRRQSADKAEIDIRIGAVNIRVAMVGDNMLPMPAVRAHPVQVKG
jgi:hypothetical protein